MQGSQNMLRNCFCFIFCFALVACHSSIEQSYHDDLQQMRQMLLQGAKQQQRASLLKKVSINKLPDVVDDDLTTGVKPNKLAAKPGVFNVSVNDMPVTQFFQGLASGTKKNIVVSPAVSGKVTLHLHDVTIKDVLDVTEELYGYQYKETQHGFQIYSHKLETVIFTINRLNISRQGGSSMSINSPSLSNSGTNGNSSNVASNVKTEVENKFWDEIKSTIQLLISEQNTKSKNKNDAKPSVAINPDTGIIVVRAYPDQLRKVKKYLMMTQKIAARQVLIEAKILDVELTDKFSNGIQWNLFRVKGGASSNDTMFAPPNGLLSNVFSATASWGKHFNGVIKMLSTQGKVSVLSSPRVSTVNNQKAVIKVGTDEYYVTNVKSNTLASGVSSSQTSNIDFEPFFSGIALDVTPQISASGKIILHIHPVISRVSDNLREFKVDDKVSQLPLARSTIREADTIVTAESGQVVIIGGLMQSGVTLNKSGPTVPSIKILDKVKAGLTDREHTRVRSELVILLKPVIIESDWSEPLLDTAEEAFSN